MSTDSESQTDVEFFPMRRSARIREALVAADPPDSSAPKRRRASPNELPIQVVPSAPEPVEILESRAGKIWRNIPWNYDRFKKLFFLENLLYRFRTRGSNSSDLRLIESSSDYGITWSAYSSLPEPMTGFGIFPVSEGGNTRIYLMGGEPAPADYSEDAPALGNGYFTDDLFLTFTKIFSGKIWGKRQPVEASSIVTPAGHFLMYGGKVSVETDYRWISRNQGKDWELIEDQPIQFSPNSIVSCGEFLFGLQDKSKDEKVLLFSEDNGVTWETDPEGRPKKPDFLIFDPYCNRLVCFAEKAIYHKLEGCKWEIVTTRKARTKTDHPCVWKDILSSVNNHVNPKKDSGAAFAGSNGEIIIYARDSKIAAITAPE